MHRPTEGIYAEGGWGGYDGLVRSHLDEHYLLLAYALGGACKVDKPECRASLQRAGLMEPAPYANLGRYWRTDSHTMRLTKAGQLRCKQIGDDLTAGKPLSFFKHMRRNYYKAVHKQ